MSFFSPDLHLRVLTQSRATRALYPAGDLDVLDGYHLCGGRVVCYRSSDPSLCEDDRESHSGGMAPGHQGRREDLEVRVQSWLD